MLVRLVIFLVTLFLLPACSKEPVYVPVATTYATPAHYAAYPPTKPTSTTRYVNGVPVTGYGEISKRTGRPRTKIVHGYWRGSHWVNSYARS